MHTLDDLFTRVHPSGTDRNETNFNGAYLDVSHSVIVEVGTGREPFAAHAALVRFLAAVDSPVSV